MTASLARTSHGPTEHGEGCGCVRCLGFQRGNAVALKHGAYSTLKLPEREAELLEELLETAPVVTPADIPTFKLLAAALARFEKATQALAQVDALSEQEIGAYMSPAASAIERIRHDQVRYLNAARKLSSDLGLTPVSRLAMGLNIAATQRELSIIDYYAAKGDE